jgi:predicted patatin/cPLA2 family phospholipase
MDTRKIAIACQGGGIHGAFTCGVLDRILKTKEDEENARNGMGTGHLLRSHVSGDEMHEVNLDLPSEVCHEAS